MQDLPTGTLTFLFTDVEGSTRLLEQLGEQYREVQQRHDAVLRAAINEHDGRVVSTEGDSFFAVFSSASDAVLAAVEAQRELAAASWPSAPALRVRMGLHTGEGVLGGDNYLGLDVNRAARIAAAAHGEQVLLSDATQCLVERSLPAGTRVRGLGQHRFKNLTQPERLFQLIIEDLRQDFPPPRTLDARPNNLPGQLTRFIGRSGEIATVRELLGRNRLLTLTGTGGTGKTRLSLEVAADSLADFADGVFFVDLSAVEDGTLVPAAIAAVLGVREQDGPLIDAVADHLRDKELLLVLDNFEQIVDAGPAVIEPLLRAAPKVKTLVASRIPLRLYGEQQFHVPPLALPDLLHLPDPEALAQTEAVALFAERAAAVRPGFRITSDNAAAVAEITARVDGLPLAIELVASRVKILPPERLLARLTERLPLLSTADRNVPERQRTLRRTIEWSYELLSDAEKQMFARQAVFSGGADIDAVDAVVNPAGELGIDTLDGLAAMVENNLVRSVDTPDGESRFTILETIREYGLERLAEAEEEMLVRCRHAEHWIELGERASPALSGPDQAAWTRRLERDQDNFRSALTWALHAGEAELGLRLGAALGEFWRLGSRPREGVRWLTDLLALPGAAEKTLLRARALSAAAELHGWIADPEAYLRLAEEALQIFRELEAEQAMPRAIANLGWAQLQNGRPQDAAPMLAEARALNIGLGDRQAAASCGMGLGLLALMTGRLEEARAMYGDALQTFEYLGNTYYVGLVQAMLAQTDRNAGDLDAAEERLCSSLSSFRAIESVMGTAWALYQFADLAVQRGRHERALRLVAASEKLLDEVGGELPAPVVATTGDLGAITRASLDELTAERAHREGLAMTAEEAVAYAVERPATSPARSGGTP